MTDGPRNAAFQRFASTAFTGRSNVIPFQSPGGRVTISRHSSSEWSAALAERFNKLTGLPRGWDGYDGKPVSFTCSHFAAQLLERLYDSEIPFPSLVPGSDGTVQIEWHINQYDIEVDVLGAFDVVATRYDCLTGHSEELELDADFTQLARWISDLKTERSPLEKVG